MNDLSRSSSAGGAAPPAAAPTSSRRNVGPRSVRGRIMAGVLIVSPLAVTAVLIKWVYEVFLAIGVKLRYALTEAAYWVFGKELKDYDRENWFDIVLAIGLTIAMLYLLGWLGSKVVGRRVIGAVESLFIRIPLVDTIYGAMKGMIHALGGVGKGGETRQSVVLIDFPTENMKTIGFMTNQILDESSGQIFATVYVPTTPNPTSGYMELVPIERVTQTDLTMEQALSMILSGGASSPAIMHLQRWGGGAIARNPPAG